MRLRCRPDRTHGDSGAFQIPAPLLGRAIVGRSLTIPRLSFLIWEVWVVIFAFPGRPPSHPLLGCWRHREMTDVSLWSLEDGRGAVMLMTAVSFSTPHSRLRRAPPFGWAQNPVPTIRPGRRTSKMGGFVWLWGSPLPLFTKWKGQF